MASRGFSAREFLSLSARVDDGSESESSDGFDDDLDSLEAPHEGELYLCHRISSLICLLDSEGPFASNQRILDASRRIFEEENIEEMVARYRRMDREVRNKDGALEDAFDLSLGARMSRVPCATSEISMFGVICKRRLEETLVIRLFNKTTSDDRFQMTSVFAVSKSPGRVYFEASSIQHVRDLCASMNFLYIKSIFYVPLEERVALLGNPKLPTSLKVDDRVKVRSGLYKGDVGSVFRVMDQPVRVIVKLKSREVRPTDSIENRGEINDFTSTSTRKRKRKQPRIEPYLIPKHPVRAELLFSGTQVSPIDDGFVFRDKAYTNDGYRLLEVRCDRVERVSTVVPGLSAPANSAAPSIIEPTSSGISVPRFLHVGNHVLISNGPAQGMSGTINQLSDESAVITFDEKNSTDLYKTSPVQAEVTLSEITRLFELGESVEVKVGAHLGRSGMIGEIKGDTVSILDQALIEMIHVSLAFIDTCAKNSSSRARYEDGDSDIKQGHRVIVMKGKHGGKEGILAVIRHHVVTVIEDVSGVEIVTGRQNIRVISTNRELKAWLQSEGSNESSTKAQQRDFFTTLAISIGMNLNEV
ncbi:hypothetical protein SCHPADRAFT_656276 [Schizopora paradoxa]|uniref:Chromatin elongation factor SPT5 n=1 Tax=Schizopora paradoxa TaxID=27342 RepID=A0A0H2RR18_9AGAM|nr:hypothetical protein SCHPADRAFT_656276 [Schizopora paradoxa]